MQYLIFNFNLLLAQTTQEKKLTILYVSLFAFFCMILFLDGKNGGKWIGGNKTLTKIAFVVMIIALIAMAVVYFVL
ncbi:MAG: hypothetical protein IKC11_06205 [Clostridia bacterium]|nr:hypothetical protein [Clostridia bacterium]